MTNKLKRIIYIFLLILLLSFFSSLSCADDFSLQLIRGQNFISLPLNPTDPFIQQAFYSIDGAYGNIWLYNNSDSDDVWKHYHPDYIGFSDLLNIKLGLGYWVEVAQDCELTTSGSPITTTFSFNLKEGWNAIGWPHLQSRSIQSALYALTFGTDYSRLCRFNPQSKSFEDYFNDSGSNQFDTFESGRAYYIYALRNCTVTILSLPQISITSPAADSLLNTPAITVSGTINYEGIAVEVNDVPAAVINTSFSANITLSEGSNTITAVATNQAGDSAFDSVAVTLDTTPAAKPVLNAITSPTGQNTQTLSGTKETNTSIWINAVERIALNGSTSWSTNVSLSEGENTFNITAKDEALNESQAVVANILLDTSAPETPVVTDDGVYTALTTQLHATWSSVDAQTGIAEYQYAIGRTAGAVDVVDWTSAGMQSEVTHTGLSLTQSQSYYISVKARNGIGLWSEIGSSDGIKVNQNAPVIIGVYPPDKSSAYTGDNINFSVDAQDQDGDNLLYRFSLDGQIIQPWQGSPKFNWSTSEVHLGIHTMKVEVSDNNGGVVSQENGLCLFRKPPGPPSQ